MRKRETTVIDTEIGNRIRIRRRQLNMSQTDLAEKLGVAFQQVQKYENGKNRVPASRLSCIANALDAHVGYFYGHDDASAGIDTAVVAGSIGLLAERHAIDLLELFQGMTSAQRNALLEIAKAFAAANAIAQPAAPGAEQGKAARLRKAAWRRPVAGRVRGGVFSAVSAD
jgi:transcriptional regulator with XRE-family HTH domain